MMELKLLASDYFYDPDFKMKIIERDPELPYPLHSHDFYELVVIISGKGTHFTRSNAFSLYPGNVFVITPGLEHGYRDVENLRLYNILFDDKLFEHSFFDMHNMSGYHAMVRLEPNYRNDIGLSTLMQLTPSQLAEIVPLLEKMQMECDAIESDIGSQSIAFAYVVQLLVTLFRIYSEHPRKDNLTIMRLADALSYLEAHMDRTVSTKELMEITNMSASTLNRHFQNATGLSPVEFHIQRRIEKACHLIRAGNLSMGEISEATGFGDANYFSRQFRKIMGMNPLKYRKSRSFFI